MLKCPVCDSNNIEKTTIEHNVEFFGKVLIDTIICKECGYKSTDILLPVKREARKIKLFVENEEDLNARVIKSSKCKIKIPELGIEISPGPYSQGYITNIEGILERIENFIIEHRDLFEKSKQEKIDEILEKIKLMREAKLKFNLILEDESGVSEIISKKAKIEIIK